MTCGRISFSIHTNELKRAASVRSSKRNRATSPPVIADSGLSSAALSEEDLSDKPVPEGQAAGGACFTCLFLVKRCESVRGRVNALQLLSVMQ